LSGDGRCAVSASSDKTLKVWDVETGRELHTLQGHTNRVRGAALSGDGRRAVSASSDNTLKVWDVETGHELRTLRGHTGFVNSVALSGDGRRALSASADNTLKVWDVDTGETAATFTCDGAVHCCTFIDDRVIAGDAGGRVHFLRLEKPKSKI
jgi:WD40 repeat protein